MVRPGVKRLAGPISEVYKRLGKTATQKRRNAGEPLATDTVSDLLSLRIEPLPHTLIAMRSKTERTGQFKLLANYMHYSS